MRMIPGSTGLLVTMLAASGAGGCPLEVLVPAYQYPTMGNMWASITGSAAANPSVRLNAILNPASGPGTSIDDNYTTAVNAARAAGVHIFAYVDTAYGARPIGDVLSDVATYLSFYAIDGVFLDQMNNAPSALGYYANLTGQIHFALAGGIDGRVIGNAGTNVPESFVAVPGNLAADVIVTYENELNSAGAPYLSTEPPAYAAGYPASQWSNIVYGIADVPTMLGALGVACQRNVGMVYFTDDELPNPYDQMPSYWQTLIRAAGCVADFNCSRSVTVQDIFDFLTAYFRNDLLADVNRDGAVGVQDIFDFLASYFAGCV